jgi:glucose/arabinose dehydrogenase
MPAARGWGLPAVAVAVALIAGGCGRSSASTDRLSAIGAGLQGPAGLTATVYASALPKASGLAVDSAGRLWVTTADYTDRGQDGLYLVARPGAVPLRVVAGLHTPLGLLWYQDSLYVTSTGRVDAFSNFDGTRFASRRAVLTLDAGVGESNEIVLAPDGRLVMGISAPCDHCTPPSKWSGTIVSFRPDGTDLRVDARGIRAPVGLAYYPGTSDLLVTMNQRDDLGSRTPGDWLAVVHRGEAWGFPECYGQAGAPCQGVPHPTAVLDKHAAVSGVAIVTGQLGRSIGTAALVAEWAAGKVQRVTLKKLGSGYASSVSPFLAGIKNPVPVIAGPDGAVLVGDWATGTVYRIAAN